MSAPKLGSRGASKVRIYIIVLLFIAAPVWAVGLALLGIAGSLNFPKDFAGGGGRGPYLKDEAFRDTSAVTNADDVLRKVLPKHPDRDKIVYIITESTKAGINPAILIGIWNGEQSGFTNPDKAFGCGVYDDPTTGKTLNRAPGFENQTSCALKVIEDAIQNRGLYTKPEGANIYTRLFYTYTNAFKQNYDAGRPGFESDNGRFTVWKALIPQYVAFDSGEIIAGGLPLNREPERTTNDPHGRSVYRCVDDQGHNVFEGHSDYPHCTGDAVDLYVPVDTPVFAPFDGAVELKNDGDKIENIRLVSPDGKNIARLAHINATVKSGTVVKGQQVGTVIPINPGPHLHFELWIDKKAVTADCNTTGDKQKCSLNLWQTMKQRLGGG